MSSGSFKELIKVVNAYIPTIDLPLPEDLIAVIQSYLDKHLPIDESDAQRLQDELINIYNKEVKSKRKRLPIFIAILRQLRPAYAGPKRLQQWWDTMLEPILEHLTEEKGLAEEIRGSLLETLTCDVDEDGSPAAKTSAALAEKLLHMWLTKSPFVFSDTDSSARFLVEQINSVLMDYGKKRPKDFLITVDIFFVKKEYRTQVLGFLCEFIRYGPPHLHQLLQTSLFTNLLRCLQIDTSTTAISLALTALTMFLPHIPNDIATHLPSLFTIYCRILFWDREQTLSPELHSDVRDPEKQLFQDDEEKTDSTWEKLSYSAECDDGVVPELLHYFTFLYGLYPLNFMSYIRKPERYLRHANFQGDEIEVQPSEVRQRSEPFRQVHLLHPNFFSLTIESELTDPNRWMKIEASDVVAACMALCEPLHPEISDSRRASVSAEGPDTEEASSQMNDDPYQRPLLDTPMDELNCSRPISTEAGNSSWRNTTSTIVGSQSGSRRPSGVERQASHPKSVPLADSPTLGPLDVPAESPTLPQHPLVADSEGKLEQAQMFRASLHRSFPNQSEISLASSHQREPSIADSYLQSLEQHQMPPSPSRSSPTEDGLGLNPATLRREIMLLKNELNFERYLKQQHLSHIGQLRQKHVRDATAEAETQNLIHSTKVLRNKLEDAKNTAIQLKRESEKSRTQAKKWEAELTAKLKTLKEEQKKRIAEVETLRRDLEASKESNTQLRQLVVTSEADDLASRQKIQSINFNVDEIERLRSEVDKLTAALRTHEAREVDFEHAKASEKLAGAKADILQLKLKSCENELDMVRLAADREIRTLNEELEVLHLQSHNQQPKSHHPLLESALAVSRTRLADIQKVHNNLLTKYTHIQAKYLALKGHLEPDDSFLSTDGEFSQYEGEDIYVTGSPPPERRNRRRGLSDPNATDRDTHSFGSTLDHSVSYVPIQPARANTGIPLRPSSQHEARSPSQRLTNSELIQHARSGSADSAQVGSSADFESAIKPKVKPQSDIRVYGRGGVQNVGTTPKVKKDKKKEEQDKKDKKSTGIRGIPYRAFT